MVVFGICLCFIFYKYKSATKRENTAIIRLPIVPIPENSHTIKIEDRLYEIINEADMLDDQQLQQIQMQKRSGYLNVFSSSNSIASCNSTKDVNNDIDSRFFQSDEKKNHESKDKCCYLESGDTTSSSSEDNPETTQDYLNPYQPITKLSPPTKREYLTLATVHRLDNSLPDIKPFAVSQSKFEPQNTHQPEMEVCCQLQEYENYSNNLKYTDPQRCLSNKRRYVSMSCKTFDCERQMNIHSNQKDIRNEKSSEDYRIEYSKVFKTKSDSDIVF